MIPFLVGFWKSVVTTVTCWFTFDGTNENVNIDSVVNDVSNNLTGTWSLWFRVSNLPISTTDVLLCFGDTDSTTRLNIGLNIFGQFQLQCYINGAWHYALVTTDASISLNTWHHLSVIQDGVSVNQYLDTTLLNYTISAGSNLASWNGTGVAATNIDNFRIGCRNWNSGGDDLFFKGDLDEVIIFNEDITTTDLDDIYGLGRSNPDLTTIDSYNRGGVSHWRLGEDDKLYDWLNFDGSNEYITINSLVADVTNDTEGTINMWIRPENLGTNQVLFSIDDSGNTYDILLFLNTSNQLRCFLRVADTIQWSLNTTTTLTDNEWVMVTLVQDGTEPVMYLDGILAPTTFTTTTDKTKWITDITPTANQAWIARRDLTLYFDGDVDSSFISSTDLIASEVLFVFNLGRNNPNYSTVSGIVSHWNMDSINPTDQVGSNDGVGVNIDSTNENIEWSIVDEVRRGWTTFDGTNEYVNVGNPTNLDFEYNEPFSYSCWVKFDTLAAPGKRIYDNLLTGAPYSGIRFLADSSGRVRFDLINTWASNVLLTRTSNNVVITGQWYHIVFTYDGSSNANGVTIYVNNVDEVLTPVYDSLSATIKNSEDGRIGGQLTISLIGDLHEFAAFNTELSVPEVNILFEQGRLNTDYSIIPSVVSHWKMDTLNPIDMIGSNSGTSINMDSTNLENDINDGTSVNMDLTNKECD